MEQKPAESNWISRPFFFMTSMVQDGFFEFSSGVKNTTSMYLNLLNVKKDNEMYHQLNGELTTRLQTQQELEIENSRLREMLEFKQKTKMSLIAAQIIGRDLVPDHNTITINKGTRTGLKAGQPVITLKGVVGYIFRPEIMTSQVMLLTDRYSVADGIIQRTRASGIVEGKGSQDLVMKYVDRSGDVQTGDLVVSGGLDNIFPKGFPLATVQNVEKKQVSVSLRISLKAMVDPMTIEEVFVITNAAKEEFHQMNSQPTTASPAGHEGLTQ